MGVKEELCECFFFFFKAEDGIRYWSVTGVQTCALPIYFRKGRHFPSRRRRLETAGFVHRESARRRYGPLRPDVQAVELRSEQEVSHRKPHLSGSADRQRWKPHLLSRARRLPGSGRAGIHRG